MAQRQQNRGPHPTDHQLFAQQQWDALQRATADMSWLLSRGYAPPSTLKLVGDRFNLVARQRTAVMRAVCSDQAAAARSQKAIAPADLAGRDLEIDAFNLLITLEAALSGGVILLARDGTYRDIASIHGSYHRVNQTRQAIELVGHYLQQQFAGRVLWRLDRPVSNSGRLSELIRDHAERHQLDWLTVLDDDPDPVLGAKYELVVSADAVVLDRVNAWANLARWIVDQEIADAWRVPMVGE